MNTQHAVSTQVGTADEKLKSERVQEPVATFRTQLKSERVQDGLVAAGEVEAPIASIELAVYQPRTVTLDLFASKVAITLSGNPAGNGSGGGDTGNPDNSGSAGASGTAG
jgi:hypothetical protein